MARILVANDSPDLAETCALVLESAGHTVEIALAFRELEDRLRAFRPELVVLDWVLGDATGDVALPLVRQLAPEVPVLVITALASVEGTARSLGATAFLHKPFEAGALIDAVERILRDRRTARARGSRAAS